MNRTGPWSLAARRGSLPPLSSMIGTAAIEIRCNGNVRTHATRASHERKPIVAKADRKVKFEGSNTLLGD